MAQRLAIYDGTTRCGSIVVTDRDGQRCKAVDARGRSLGQFGSIKLAIQAINNAYDGKLTKADCNKHGQTTRLGGKIK